MCGKWHDLRCHKRVVGPLSDAWRTAREDRAQVESTQGIKYNYFVSLLPSLVDGSHRKTERGTHSICIDRLIQREQSWIAVK